LELVVEYKRKLTVSQDLPSPETELLLDALGDRTRRVILHRLRNGPLAVVDISRGLEVSRSAVSQHLRVLREAGLVFDRPIGNRRFYALDPAGLALLREFLEDFWSDALSRFSNFAETSAESQSP
jgi:DNA-binding transcriptional ArsR family regulator